MPRQAQHKRILAFPVRPEPVEGQVYTERCIYETSANNLALQASLQVQMTPDLDARLATETYGIDGQLPQ